MTIDAGLKPEGRRSAPHSWLRQCQFVFMPTALPEALTAVLQLDLTSAARGALRYRQCPPGDRSRI